MSTGMLTSWPSTRVASSRGAQPPSTCGAKPSSANAAWLSDSVTAPLGAGEQGQVDRPRQQPACPPLRLGDRLEPLVSHGPTPPAGSRRTASPAPGSGRGSAAPVRPAPRRRASGRPLGRGPAPSTRDSAVAPWPWTHSGSGPSSGSPVKNFAAMQPPRQASYAPAGPARAAALRLAQRPEQLGLPPDRGEPARRAHVAGQEGVVDGERAGVDVADRVDQADHPAGAAQVEPRQRLPVPGQVEERVAGQHALAVRDQPVVELALLRRGRVQLVPDVGPATGRAQPGQPQLGAVRVGERLERVQLRRRCAGCRRRRA